MCRCWRQFNLTDVPSATSSPSAAALPQRDLLEDIQNGASSLLAVAATRVSDAAGHVESAISSSVASLPELPRLDDYVPQNCSFGMHQFCVGYRDEQSLSCSDAPFEISALQVQANDRPTTTDPLCSPHRQHAAAYIPSLEPHLSYTTSPYLAHHQV
jgi:hypothetical protein